MSDIAANLKKCREILAFASAVCRAEGANFCIRVLYTSFFSTTCEPTALEHLLLKFIVSIKECRRQYVAGSSLPLDHSCDRARAP